MPVFRLFFFLALAISALTAAAGQTTVPAQPPPRELYDLTNPAILDCGLEVSLAQTSVHCLTLDALGRLWVGTKDGAAYLGSQGWTALPFPREAPSRYIRSMLQSSDGSMWFGTEDGGMLRLSKGTWTHFAGNRDIPAQRVNCLAEVRGLDGSKELLAGTAGGGVVRFDGRRWVPFPLPPAVADNTIWNIREISDSRGTPEVWIASGGGLAVRRGAAWVRMDAASGFREGSVNDVIGVVKPDGSRETWAACWKEGVARLDGRQWKVIGPPEGFPSLHPTSLATTPKAGGGSILWVGTYDAGLFWLDDGVWRHLDTHESMPNQGVYALLANPGNVPGLWVGTRGGGLAAIILGGWRRFDETPIGANLFANCMVEAVGNSGQKSFWIGTNRGILSWDGRRFGKEGVAEGLPSEYINSLAALPGKDGPEIWAGTLQGVACRRNGRWVAYGKAEGLPQVMTSAVLASRNAQGKPILWAGMESCLARWENDRWSVIPPPQGMPFPVIYNLTEVEEPGGGSSLWVGFRSGGVARYHGGGWERFGAEHGLPTLTVYDMVETCTEEGQRFLWAGTQGRGVVRLALDRPDARWEIFDAQRLPQLPSEIVYRLEKDRGGNLYLMTVRGVARLNLSGPNATPVVTRTYTAGDGLPAPAANIGASTVDSRGHIWIGTTRGITALDPQSEILPQRVKGPYLERVALDGNETMNLAALELDYRPHRLLFEFGLPLFHRREDIRYRTQLAGLEESPGDWQKEARRELSGLPSGRFKLWIWARDYAGTLYGPLEFPISVQAAPWKRWWAFLVYGVGLAGTGFLVARLRTGYLRRRNRALEILVRERTLALAEANEALENLSLTDPLTSLRNRRYLDAAMPEMASRIRRRQVGRPPIPADASSANRDLVFFMVDLDHFKNVNDEYGHHAGDTILRQTADLMKGCVREADCTVRFGGEEFLISAVDTDRREAPVLAERIRERIGSFTFMLDDGVVVRKTCSVGFASYPLCQDNPDLISWERIVDLADQCLYLAKNDGRDRWAGILPVPEAALPPGFDFHHASVGDLLSQGLVKLITGPKTWPCPTAAAPTRPITPEKS